MILKRIAVLFILSFASLLLCARSELVEVIDLNANWSITNQNLTISKSNIHLPSGIYSILHDEDILYSYNDIHMRWIAQDNWTYTRAFKVSRDHLPKHYCNLTFHGIDTVAEIRLNNHVLGRTDNMFVRYSYDITKLLTEDNVIEVQIFSPIQAAKKRATDFAVNGTLYPPNCPSDRYHGECNVNMLRKMQTSFSWDFAPAVPSMGIWKSVHLECYDVAIIRDVDVVISRTKTHWKADMYVYVDVGGTEDFFAELKFYAFGLLDEPVIIKDYTSKQRLLRKNPVIMFSQTFPLNSVIAWWPNGYGSQTLYTFNFVLNAWLTNAGPNAESPTVSQKSIRIGFRTVELVEQELADRNGYTFLFRINGEDIFIKGANYMPSHVLPEKMQDHERLKHLLTSAKDANMNMLRVWGGGIYESDLFYELADALGLLIWQDMTFSSAMYPVDEAFLDSVRTEVLQNARRLAYHPSLVVMAANSENELALAQNLYGTLVEQKRFETEYRTLYVKNVIRQLKSMQHPARISPLQSTPSIGKRGEKYDYISPDPQSAQYGDVHFFVVHENGWNVNIYPTPRFVSEYGFQSLPRTEAWKRSMQSSDNLMEIMRHRQHHPMAMLPIVNLIRPNLPLPLTKDTRYTDALIYFSQIAQAMALKVETEWYRSLRSSEHRTMGALYWQLNDVWVAPSWSTIDFFGNYKLAYYWSKEFLAPITIIALTDTNNAAINVTIACDQLEVSSESVHVTVQLFKYDNLTAVNLTRIDTNLKSNSAINIRSLAKNKIFNNVTTEKNTFLKFILHKGPVEISSTYYFPMSFNNAEGISDPELAYDLQWMHCIEKEQTYENAYTLKIVVKRPAFFVFIDIIHPKVGKFKLSQNGFVQTSDTMKVNLQFNADECIILQNSNVIIKTIHEFIS
ncbi:beta-mannosidase isoform X2 [Zeugodacus cucurbitae]|uniref:beta-mannosidase isoform X2 n=1 Tax=Zeugodacus cucurbitae TaxID=28588 RepID=UPI0023D8E392|nr:beta-mannosidase isoform X2 [Zeugodacus cucurbitae]